MANYDVSKLAGAEWTDYVRAYDLESPFPQLLLIEVRRLIKRARMTDVEAITFELYVARGLSVCEIAKARNVNRRTVMQSLKNACIKAESVEHCGLLTTMIEVFSAEDVLEAGGTNWWRAVRRMIGKMEKER